MEISAGVPSIASNPVETAVEPAAPTQMIEPVPMHWTPLSRVGFRVAFLYFFCFLFFDGNGTIFSIFPVVGDWIEMVLTWPFNHLAEWTGQHVVHLTGLAATWHPTGSGDTALNWVLNGLFLVFAVAGGMVWSLVSLLRGNRRKEYQTLYAWLRFGLRLTCGFFMLNYGLAKLFPLQMAPISIAILNEPVGQSSPMTLLWSLIGMNPIYEMICGFAEVMGGLLFLFRRTALLGALLSAFVMTNVLLYNLFFDVPVKLFAANLLLASLFVVLPDVRALFCFFWLHKPAAPAGVWIPPASRRWSRIAMRTVEWAFALGFVVALPIYDGMEWHRTVVAARTQTPLLGAWSLDKSHPASGSFITGEGLPATDLYIDTAARAFTRATDGALWRTYLDLNAKEHTLTINCFPTPGVTYAWAMPDANHLTLTSTPPEADKSVGKSGQKPVFMPAVVTLTRTQIPSHYPLLDRGYHSVNQWGLER